MDNKLAIIIDIREDSLYNDIFDRDLDIYKDKIDITKTPLDIGDVHIKYNDILYIFERKTVKDLISSIHDGRYREQKARMLSIYNTIQLSYIIEEDDVISSKIYSNKSVIQGAYINTMFRDNIRVLFTKKISETATLLLSIAVKIIENPKKFISGGNAKAENVSGDSCYTDYIKLKKKKIDNIDEDACYIMQLSQIPHISNIIAKNIAKIYPTMPNLITSLISNDNKIKELCKIDGVGKEKAATIVKYLFGDKCE
jgi:crossover junction endonuclease MUS81